MNEVSSEYARLIDAANAPIFGVDSEGRVTVWNKRASFLSGFSSEEVMGQNLVSAYITADFQEKVKGVLDMALRGEETANFEFPLVTKSGATLQILLNATTRKNDRGEIIGMVGIGQDITSRLAQEREYVKLIDTANAPIFGVDSEGRVTVWNKRASFLSGFSSEEVMGQNLVSAYITADFQEKVKGVLDMALRGEETANFEFPLVTKSGATLQILLNATTRRNDHGTPIGVVGIGTDVTQLKIEQRGKDQVSERAKSILFLVYVYTKTHLKTTPFR